MDESKQPGIQIAQVFLERATFSHRDDALALPPNTPFQPEVVVNLQGGVASDGKTAFLRITVHTKPEDKPLYNFTVSMFALLQVVEGQENLPLKEYVEGGGPAMLYPFVREAVASLTWRGRFGPVWLAPFNIGAAIGRGAAPELQKIRKAPRVSKRARSPAAR